MLKYAYRRIVEPKLKDHLNFSENGNDQKKNGKKENDLNFNFKNNAMENDLQFLVAEQLCTHPGVFVCLSVCLSPVMCVPQMWI